MESIQTHNAQVSATKTPMGRDFSPKFTYIWNARESIKRLVGALGLASGEYEILTNQCGLSAYGYVGLYTADFQIHVDQMPTPLNGRDVLVRVINDRYASGDAKHVYDLATLSDTSRMLAELGHLCVRAWAPLRTYPSHDMQQPIAAAA